MSTLENCSYWETPCASINKNIKRYVLFGVSLFILLVCMCRLFSHNIPQNLGIPKLKKNDKSQKITHNKKRNLTKLHDLSKHKHCMYFHPLYTNDSIWWAYGTNHVFTTVIILFCRCVRNPLSPHPSPPSSTTRRFYPIITVLEGKKNA